MKPSSALSDGLDTTNRNHDYFIDGSEMHGRDRSVDTGTVVDTTSELVTPKNLDITALRSVLPQSMAEENLPFPPVDLRNTREFATPHYRQILFSLANNFAGLGGAADVKKIIKFLQEETRQGLFQLIYDNSSHSARAIAQSIFTGAIEFGDARLIDLLLSKKSTGIDVNEFWCHIEGTRYTPIERGSLLRHKEVIKVLLEHDADVNRTDPERRSRPSGALECAVGITGKDYTRVDPQIFHMLLHAGGNLSQQALDNLIQRRDGEFVGLLMSANAHKNVAKWSRQGIFRDAVLFLDDRTAVAIIRTMLDIRADLNFYVKRSYDQEIYHPCRVIDVAARRGNMEMIEILLGSEALLTNETLLFAVVSGNQVLVRFILDRGAKVNSHHRISSHWIETTFGEILTTPLAEAIRLQDTEIIGLLQQYGPIRLDGRTQFSAAIIAASEVGNVPFIKDLIQRGSQDRGNDLGYALAVAIKEGQNEAATMLIDAGANMNEYATKRDGIGPPLVEALARRDAGLVHLLLEVGALPNVSYGKGRMALQLAVEWGDRSIVETLILAGADMNDPMMDEEEAPLTLAVKSQEQTLVKLLLDAGAEINSYHISFYGDTVSSALEAALGNKDISMACYLLERGADAIDTQALGNAMIESPQFFDLLLEKHKIRYPVIQAKFGCNALIRAIELEDEHAIRRMLDNGLDASSLVLGGYRMCSPFGYAIADSTIEVIEMFLQKGSNPNSIVTEPRCYDDASYRLTGFLAAIDTGTVSKVKLLHSYGADVNFPARTRVKHTPLQRAAAIGNTDIVELLIRLGAEVNAAAAQRGGGTALQFAAIGGYIPVACSLLNSHADVNAPASKVNGRMALEGAAEHGRLDMLKLLLNAGAGNEGKDQGQLERAKALAKDQGYSHITDLLDTYLQPKEQENEPVMLADGVDDGLGMWDPNLDIDGFDMGPMDGGMFEDVFSSTVDSGQMYLGDDMDLFQSS